MGEIIPLFDALLKSFLDSFSPEIDQTFSILDNQISSGQSTEQLDDLLQQLLTDFPRCSLRYQDIISILTLFAASAPDTIIESLCARFKNELTRSADQPSTTLMIASFSFAATNFHHFQFLHFLILLILSDLILSIFKKYPSQKPIIKIVPCGYNICMTKHGLKTIQLNLIDTWSEIFRLISKISIDKIVKLFDRHSDEISTTFIYHLIGKLESNHSFLDIVFNSFQQNKKHKTISSEMMSALSLFLSKAKCENNVLDEFFQIAWSNRSAANLKDGAIDMICVLLNRLPAQQSKEAQFYTKRVLKHAGDRDKIERSARSFLTLIRGDISGVDPEKDPYCIQTVGNNFSSESFISLFMKNFYENSDFSICPKVFSEIIAHLASIDIKEFEKSVLPVFIQLGTDKSKFISFVNALPIINSEQFLQLATCQPKPEDIASINQKVQSRIISFLTEHNRLAADNYLTLTREILQLQSSVDESDNAVLDFLTQNNYFNFDTNNSSLKCPTIDRKEALVLQAILRSIPYIADSKSFKSTDIFEMLIRFMCHSDIIVSSAASEVYSKMIKNQKFQKIFTERSLSMLLISSGEVTAKCLSLLQDCLGTTNYTKKHWLRFECAVFCCFVSDLPYCRAIALAILKHLSATNVGEIYKLLHVKSAMISEGVNRCINILNVPFKPTMYKPPIGVLDFEHACCSRYNDLWLIFFAEILNTLIDSDCMPFLKKCREIVSSICLSKSAAFTQMAVRLLYIDSFSFDVDSNLVSNEDEFSNPSEEDAKKGQLSPPQQTTTPSSSAITTTEDDETTIEEQMKRSKSTEPRRKHHNKNKKRGKSLDNISKNEAETDENEGEEQTAQPGIESLIKKILSEEELENKQALINSFRFLNWRVIPNVLPFLLSIEENLYADAAASLTFIIQNPDNFTFIISDLFRKFLTFLSMLQSYFVQLKINSPREIIWDEEHVALLQRHQDLCVNYCILISAAFNNIQDQISEEDFPLPSRQVLVKFLSHWAQLPNEFERIQAYAINALIPIIHAGTVYTEGFSFEMPMLEMMVQCQLNGFMVLDSLLFFHLDILLDEFIKCSLLRPKREAQLFLEAIISALMCCNDASVLQTHVGSLILIAMYFTEEQEDAAQKIMRKIALLFLDKAGQYQNNVSLSSTRGAQPKKRQPPASMNDQEVGSSVIAHNYDENEVTESPQVEEEDTKEEEEEREDLTPENIVTKFQFAIEQVIDSGLEIIRSSPKITVTKSIVTILSYFFEKIRILPTHSFIIQGIPSKFRKFTVTTFFDLMYSVSSSLNDEFHDVFGTLWYNLLSNSDNNVVVLLCLFESNNAEIKERIFSQLLEKVPTLISKYLAKRCTFAYWYFLRTYRQLDVSSITWMFPVLTRAFTSFITQSARHFTTVFHFSLLFIEEAGDLFETLINVFGFEVVSSLYIWSQDDEHGCIHATTIITDVVNILKEQKQDAIDKWSQEAFRWAVACCDIKRAYRSLVIFNALNTILPQQYIPLLIKAVQYHLSRVSEDDCGEVALYVGVCFEVFQGQLEVSDIISTAFNFASLFLHCPAFAKGCMRKAMPLFLQCTETPTLAKNAKAIIADAFIPFLRDLEEEDESQKLLKEITTKCESPELLLIAACFLLKPLPFIEMDKKYDEIVAAPISSENANKTMVLFSTFIKTASRSLVDSILQVSTVLIRKFERAIERNLLMPVYKVALQRVSDMKSAVDFMTALLRIDPEISSSDNQEAEESKYLEDIQQGLNGFLVNSPSDSVPITNCKQISQLSGMIDQQNPPKILPFSSQYEMYVGLRKDSKGGRKKQGKKWSSSLSLTSGALSNRSLILPSSLELTDFSQIELEELPQPHITMKLLNIPTDGKETWNFVVSSSEFLQLDQVAE